MRHATSSEHANDATGEIDGFVCCVEGELGSLRSVVVDVVQTAFRNAPILNAYALAPQRFRDVSTIGIVI
jgi:hypothetical protein